MKVMVTIVRIIVGVLFIFSGLVKLTTRWDWVIKCRNFLKSGAAWFQFMDIINVCIDECLWDHCRICFAARLEDQVVQLVIIIADRFLYIPYRVYLHYGYAQKLRLFWWLPADNVPNIFLKRCGIDPTDRFPDLETEIHQSPFSEKPATIVMLGITILSFGFQWYTLTYLPVVDCLPLRKATILQSKWKCLPMLYLTVPSSLLFTKRGQGSRVYSR